MVTIRETRMVTRTLQFTPKPGVSGEDILLALNTRVTTIDYGCLLVFDESGDVRCIATNVDCVTNDDETERVLE